MKVSDTRPNSSAHPINQYDWDFSSSFDMKGENKNSRCQPWSKALQFLTKWLIYRSELAAHFSNNCPNWSGSLEKIDCLLLCWIPTVIFLVFLLPLCFCPQHLCFLLCAYTSKWRHFLSLACVHLCCCAMSRRVVITRSTATVSCTEMCG